MVSAHELAFVSCPARFVHTENVPVASPSFWRSLVSAFPPYDRLILADMTVSDPEMIKHKFLFHLAWTLTLHCLSAMGSSCASALVVTRSINFLGYWGIYVGTATLLYLWWAIVPLSRLRSVMPRLLRVTLALILALLVFIVLVNCLYGLQQVLSVAVDDAHHITWCCIQSLCDQHRRRARRSRHACLPCPQGGGTYSMEVSARATTNACHMMTPMCLELPACGWLGWSWAQRLGAQETQSPSPSLMA
jgi:hypothetical protein